VIKFQIETFVPLFEDFSPGTHFFKLKFHSIDKNISKMAPLPFFKKHDISPLKIRGVNPHFFLILLTEHQSKRKSKSSKVFQDLIDFFSKMGFL
jgi:hypothetical protein